MREALAAVPALSPVSARAASTSSASGLDGLSPHLRNSAGAGRDRPYLSHVEGVRASQLLAARVHLGHQSRKLNPRLTGLLQGFRHNIAIYDINRTWRSMRTIFYGFAEMAAHRSSFFLLAPNENLPMRALIEALRKQYPFRHDRFGSLYMTGYVDRKWIDGIFSNWKVTAAYVKHVKEVLVAKPASSKYRKLARYLRGIEGLGNYGRVLPDFVLVLAGDRGAMHEARNAELPLVGLVDTDSQNADQFLYPVYANDDSVESIQFVLDLVKRGVEEGRKREQEAFALLMVRKMKQALDPVRGTAFGLTDAAGAGAGAGAKGGARGGAAADAWVPRPAVAAERPAWVDKLNVYADAPAAGSVKLDRV
jgi:small subunit ribosomal protein S2